MSSNERRRFPIQHFIKLIEEIKVRERITSNTDLARLLDIEYNRLVSRLRTDINVKTVDYRWIENIIKKYPYSLNIIPKELHPSQGIDPSTVISEKQKQIELYKKLIDRIENSNIDSQLILSEMQKIRNENAEIKDILKKLIGGE